MPKSKMPAKPPTVPYRFIRPDSEIGRGMYALLQDLVDAHHEEIRDARIALAWHTRWKPDLDGHITLGQCRKVSELEREVADLVAYDFLIVLRQEFWSDLRVTNLQRRALLDHELAHAGVKLDEHGDPMRNECGRIVYRLRKHDLEEFAEIAERYGCWKRDIEAFATVLDRARSRSREWVGYQRLQAQLTAAGAAVGLDAMLGWTETERREAEVWATLVLAPDLTLEAECPPHVIAALRPDASAPTSDVIAAPVETVSH